MSTKLSLVTKTRTLSLKIELALLLFLNTVLRIAEHTTRLRIGNTSYLTMVSI
ncbi:hypothetical protein BN1723_016552 [Verticillium longisporum]|uniref:Uncharacterized protein n=1 Tax=Verticillium longisporum TaxID=100787 RepID=A0A0G4KS58_VERLO|nr:hypothetical protein BN1708_010525 [Verticillium longisporum]CRK45493.1 hypothetical protein BN1723_016552 [Verticillium longisporum]